jgi:hypothetical protein
MLVVAPGFVLLGLVGLIIPFVVLYLVADAWGQSKLHVFWGFLSWTGLIAGIIVMAILRGQERSAGASTIDSRSRTIR